MLSCFEVLEDLVKVILFYTRVCPTYINKYIYICFPKPHDRNLIYEISYRSIKLTSTSIKSQDINSAVFCFF